MIELDRETRLALVRYAQNSRSIKAMEETQRKARDEIIAYLTLNEVPVGTVDGLPAVRVVTQDRSSLDTDRMKIEQPFLYQKYQRAPVRVESLRVLQDRW